MIGSRRFLAILLALGLGLSLALPAEAQRPDRVKIGGTVAVTGRFSSDWGPGIIEFMKGWERLVNAEGRSEEHTSELQSRPHLLSPLLLEKKKKKSSLRQVI